MTLSSIRTVSDSTTAADMPSDDALVRRLRAAGCVAAEEEAAELREAAELLATGGDVAVLEALVQRREQGEPLAWITGTLSFCGLRLRIDAGVYVPRIQSEELARRAIAVLQPGGRAADLCSGAGAVAAVLAGRAPDGVFVVAVDIDRAAVECARRNHRLVVQGDLGAALRSGVFDVVTAVTPYVPKGEFAFLPADVRRFEPRLALDGGEDGLEVMRRVVGCAARLLRPGGWLLVEMGGEQDVALAPLLVASSFGEVTTWHDEDGDLRGLAARLRRR